MILWTLLGSLGIGGIASVAGLVFFPQITLRLLSGAASIGLGLASKALAKFFSGSEWIFQRKDATFALFVFALVGGFVFDRYNPIQAVLTWAPSTSHSASSSKADAPPKKQSQTHQQGPLVEAFDYVRKALGAY